MHRALFRAEITRTVALVASVFTFGVAVSGGPGWLVSAGALSSWLLTELYRWLVDRKWDAIEEERALRAAERAVGIERRR